MTDDQRRKVEQMIREHLQSGGVLSGVSAKFATTAGVSQKDVELVMLRMLDCGEIRFESDWSLRLST